MAAILTTEERVDAVHIDGLAALKIIKHCQESLPQMVTGSLLGLSVGKVLEITHAFPFPEPVKKGSSLEQNNEVVDELFQAADHMDGHEYQLEMMKMLREVNVDNNCVGWYQSMYLGSYSTQSLLENQLSYQTDLSSNAVVILYDPIQTTHGKLTLKCLRLTDECVTALNQNKNAFVDPKRIFEELPVTFTNPGLIQALLCDISQGTYDEPFHYPTKTAIDDGEDPFSTKTTTLFDNLDLSTNPYLEKHLEFLCSWVDDLASEQQKFNFYARSLARQDHVKNRAGNKGGRQTEADTLEGWASPDAPRRIESLLITNQIRNYCDQVNQFAGTGFGKLFLASSVHKEDRQQS
mmetsp:Transcript_28007/g.40088  ORF Transcript_28007/g.40088 Transcript_28007/m.40088 type:complete len:350 (+) Transcript_28007:124-1173(+)